MTHEFGHVLFMLSILPHVIHMTLLFKKKTVEKVKRIFNKNSLFVEKRCTRSIRLKTFERRYTNACEIDFTCLTIGRLPFETARHHVYTRLLFLVFLKMMK